MRVADKGPWGRIEGILFAALFLTYAWFFQGGGWNQNARFDQVRAIVEQGRLSVDDYLVYRAGSRPDGTREIRRHPLPSSAEAARVRNLANTGDLTRSSASGRYYPNKPPGTVWLAVPAYLVVQRVESWAGVDPDRWWVLNLNHHLATVFSVSLIGALGALIFLRVSRRLLPDLPAGCHLAAAATLGLGTPMLPFSTMLFDHVEAAVLLLLAFGLLLRAGDEGAASGRWPLVAAGVAAGAAVAVSYLSALVVVWLALYAAFGRGTPRRAVWFVAGGLPAALLLAAYHSACFGSPWALANTLQNPMFAEDGRWLGVFGWPRPGVALQLLVGARRGLFFFAPVLVAAVVGLAGLAWRGSRRREARLCLALFATLWTLNASFNEWHAGFSLGPRYLIPAIPFLALGLAPAFARWPRPTALTAAVSALLLLGATAVDAQPPPAFSNPLLQYYRPLVVRGTLEIQGIPLEGPLSVNPIGSYEPWYYSHFPPGSEPARWNSFNLGELLWPGRPASLAPLLFWLGCCAGLLAWLVGRLR